MKYQISLKNIEEKSTHPLGSNFEGTSPNGDSLAVNNFFLEKNGQPFFGISGEFHFSRMQEHRWEDELIKMKLAGINIVSTYVFWNHHEEEEGVFDFGGRRDLRKFLKLCQKQGLMVIMRVGPFCHGEVRNGGLPDWLYGKPFDVRTRSKGFMDCVRRLYSQIGEQVEGLMFKDGGPVIGIQIDNEYMHSAAPWEMTTGVSNEWVFGGDEGNDYMRDLKDMAAECGLCPVFYTCTGWGGAATPDDMLPLWGGYAYRPWLFYEYAGEHPATEEYIYQDFHNNGVVCTNDFKPSYKPEDRPYACCEMGGGMMCSYNYRFVLPKKSIDAMANIKLGSGCNFLGYYMFQGGSNPVGVKGTFLNESQVSKISYDYQAALGEFGQERESYRRLKTLHYFINSFGNRLCKLKTILPEGASQIDPTDLDTLRYAVRSDGKSGFLFVNNFQDHRQMLDRCGDVVDIKFEGKDAAENLGDHNEVLDRCDGRVDIDIKLEDWGITEKFQDYRQIPDRCDDKVDIKRKNRETLEDKISFNIDIAGDENAILPFNFDMDGINLVKATAQPVCRIENDGMATYVFMIPDGMKGQFVFEEGCLIKNLSKGISLGRVGVASGSCCSYAVDINSEDVPVLFSVSRKANDKIDLANAVNPESCVQVLVVNRKLAGDMFLVDNKLYFTEGALLVRDGHISVETTRSSEEVWVYPSSQAKVRTSGNELNSNTKFTEAKELNTNAKPNASVGVDAFMDVLNLETNEKHISAEVSQVGTNRYTIDMKKDSLDGIKDALLQIDYHGDIGYAFINGQMVHDNFYNGETWEIGLSDLWEKLWPKIKAENVIGGTAASRVLTVYINPLKKGAKVNVESAMAGRREEVASFEGGLDRVAVMPVYELDLPT